VTNNNKCPARNSFVKISFAALTNWQHQKENTQEVRDVKDVKVERGEMAVRLDIQ
jgi:hypothetical protein